jgi:spoIIIJ-associated protein
MKEIVSDAQNFLNRIFETTGLSLRASAEATATDYLFEIVGEDVALLRNEGGEVLDALDHLINQIFGRALAKGERFVCDVQGYRATRDAELRMMARHAAERVRATGQTFTFGPMSASERRVIHLALADAADLHTESVGFGESRRLSVSRKK